MKMENLNKSYYAVIPANVRYDDDLSPNAKLLYGEITALTNETGYCWASNDYFAQLYKVDKVTISRWIGQLKAKNYIEINLIYKENSKEVETREIKLLDKKITVKGKEKKPSKPNKQKETKQQYGTYVFLTETEYNKLCEDYTQQVITNKIKEIDNWLYKKFNGDEAKARAYYKDYNKALRNTWLGDPEQYKPKAKTTSNTAINTNTSGIYFDENGELQRR